MTTPIFRQRRLYQQVAEHLGRRISRGEFPPISPLPSEHTLASEYGVSRNVMRESLVALELLGMVTVRAGAGAFVNGAAHAVDTSLARITEAAGPSPLAILEARRAIEGEVAFQAALSAEDAEIAALAALLACAVRGNDAEIAEMGWPASFHVGLARATHNPVFVAIVEGLWQAVAGPMFAGLRAQVSLDQIESRLRTRQRILDCVRRRDSAATRTAMHAHIDMVAHDLYPRRPDHP